MEIPDNNQIINKNINTTTNISLCDLQKWMRWIVVDPRGVEEALKNPNPSYAKYTNRYMAPQISAYSFLVDSKNLNVNARLSVYAEGYFSRIAEVLEKDFSLTHKVLGHEQFLELICDYLKAYPSRTPNISEVGSLLPLFVKNHSFQKKKSYLYDIISLEWKLVESLYANSMPPLDIQALAAISEEQWENAKIICDQSLRLMESDWPIDDWWRSTTVAKHSFLRRDRRFLCIYRSSHSVVIETIARLEYKILKFMRDGYTLGEITDKLNIASENLTNWFAKWTQCGIIKRIKL